MAVLAVLALPSAASAESAEYLGYARSSSMYSNATDTINGQPQPATLLRLQNQKFTVRSVPLGTVKSGETVKALSEVEVTNDLVTKDVDGNNVYHDAGVAAQLIIATSPTATTGIEVGESEATTVTPQVHHWTFEKSGTFRATQNYSGRYLNLVMWAYSPESLTQCWTFPRSSLPNPQQPRDCGVDVYYDRGHLSVLRDASSSAAPAGAVPFSVQSFDGQSVPEASPSDAPITYAGQPPQLIAAMARPVAALKKGDILTAQSALQVDARNVVRSNTSCNVMVATQLYLSPSPTSLSGAVALGSEGGQNFTGRGQRQIKTLEQGVVPSSATYKLTQDYTSQMYVVLRAWTLGNSACELYGNGIRVQLSQPQSFMHVMRYRTEVKAKVVADTYNSGDSSERTNALDSVLGTPAVVYSLPLTKVAPGQLIETIGEIEVDTSYHRAAIHTMFVLADGPASTTGTSLDPDHFTEVNPYMASLPINDSAAWTVPSGVSGTKYLNLVASAQQLQTLGTAPDNNVTVAPDGGRLVVQRFRATGP
ncbi:MAG TPA: hypothetical protein VLB79_08075 [Solirubrobacterales bacterium]|nr:hypothetical protein [Solirubrobacterales bacterium]